MVAGLMALCSTQVFAQNDNTYRKQHDQNAKNTKKETPTKIIEFIVGEWEAEEVYKGQKEVSDTDTLATDQIMAFDREGKYSISTGSGQIDSGSYRISEQHNILYLESAEHTSPPSEWRVTFSDDGKMFLRKRDEANMEDFKFVYRRKN